MERISTQRQPRNIRLRPLNGQPDRPAVDALRLAPAVTITHRHEISGDGFPVKSENRLQPSAPSAEHRSQTNQTTRFHTTPPSLAA